MRALTVVFGVLAITAWLVGAVTIAAGGDVPRLFIILAFVVAALHAFERYVLRAP
jgi:hypothetical protein